LRSGSEVRGSEARDVDLEHDVKVVGLAAVEKSLIAPFRRAVVSIRLNEEEMTLLRQRAAESGISISEYVRSCVVEADQLRVQVKQVVADMRSAPTAERREGVEAQLASQPRMEAGARLWSSFLSRWGGMFLGRREPLAGTATAELRCS